MIVATTPKRKLKKTITDVLVTRSMMNTVIHWPNINANAVKPKTGLGSGISVRGGVEHPVVYSDHTLIPETLLYFGWLNDLPYS